MQRGQGKLSLSMKMRADSVLQAKQKSEERSPVYVHNYSLPRLEQGWTSALRMSDEKEERIRKMKATRSIAPVVHAYERLSGLHETEINLGQFPDRGQIMHPSVVCVRCSDPASICVPCSEQLIQDGISVYINSRAKGAAYLFQNAISRSASSTVLRFVVFKIWSNSMFTRRIQRMRRMAESRRRNFRKLCFLPFRAWQHYAADIVHEKKDRKTSLLEKRVKQLEEQLLKLQAEHKDLSAKHVAISAAFEAESTLCEERRIRIIEMDDQAALDDKKIVFLAGFMAPLLKIADRVDDLCHGQSQTLAEVRPQSDHMKFIAPSGLPPKPVAAPEHYDTLLQWINFTASQDHFDPNIRIRGVVPMNYIPMVPAAPSVEALMDGKLFCRAVVSLILHSDAFDWQPLPPAEDSPLVAVCTQDSNISHVSMDDAAKQGETELQGNPAVPDAMHSQHSDDVLDLVISEETEVSELSPKPILYEADESTPEKVAAVETMMTLLAHLNDNRASPKDLILLSMEAAGYFLHIPVTELEDGLSLDSITCILYRISYLRLFTAPIDGFSFTLLPEEISKLAELRASMTASKTLQDIALPAIAKVAHLYEKYMHPLCMDEDVEAEEEVAGWVEASTSGEVQEGEGGAEGEVIERKELDGSIVDESAETAEEGESMSPPHIYTPDELLQHLHEAVADIVNSGRSEEMTASFMGYFSVALEGLKDMNSVVAERRLQVEGDHMKHLHKKATNHGFVAQKTLNYLQF